MGARRGFHGHSPDIERGAGFQAEQNSRLLNGERAGQVQHAAGLRSRCHVCPTAGRAASRRRQGDPIRRAPPRRGRVVAHVPAPRHHQVDRPLHPGDRPRHQPARRPQGAGHQGSQHALLHHLAARSRGASAQGRGGQLRVWRVPQGRDALHRPHDQEVGAARARCAAKGLALRLAAHQGEPRRGRADGAVAQGGQRRRPSTDDAVHGLPPGQALRLLDARALPLGLSHPRATLGGRQRGAGGRDGP
mmetsp:Transcript_22087/g.47642  ORF Transcript_22087/g.47642 Transcript_22087/m.47642 type:complete len:247 (-) Transcript_22087:1274-2014(-)